MRKHTTRRFLTPTLRRSHGYCTRRRKLTSTYLNSHRTSYPFFQKLVLCRGLKFAFPQRVSSIKVKASFEKAYWRLEPNLPDDLKELSAATLRSIALNYIHRRGPKPPKSLHRAIHELKQREDVVITKPDKGSGVVVMDKSEYLRLLSEASINETTKFRAVDPERPKTRGRPPRHLHPLLQKEKELESIVRRQERIKGYPLILSCRRILPKVIADSVRTTGSWLAHPDGLPKTHKEHLAMRPILFATQTYNYRLAKWLEEKLQPLFYNKYTITNTFDFVSEIRELQINSGDILVSYDVSLLFTNVPLEETIQILADKAFTDNWFNKTYQLNLSRMDLVDLLRASTKDQLFQFNGQLYEQTDGVAMGSPLGPRLANVFMGSIEET